MIHLRVLCVSGIYGGSPAEQGPASEGVGGFVLLPGRSQFIHRGSEPKQHREKQTRRVASLLVHRRIYSCQNRIIFAHCLSISDNILIFWHVFLYIFLPPPEISVIQGSFCFFTPDDHSRVKLKSDVNATKQDYINASFIVRSQPGFHIPRNGCLIALLICTLITVAHSLCSFSLFPSLTMTPGNQLTSPHRGRWLTQWLISGR